MPPKPKLPPVPLSPLQEYQNMIAKVRKALSVLMSDLETYPQRPPASIPAESLAAWEEQASQTASQHFKRSILTVCHSLLTLRTHLRTPDLLPHLKTPIPCDYLDLLDHGSTLGFGLNPDVYCRELVRRVLLFSEGLERRREGWSVVCERVKRITEGGVKKEEEVESEEKEEKEEDNTKPKPKIDPVTYLQDVIDNLCLSFYYSLEGSREAASMGIAMGAKRDEERVRNLGQKEEEEKKEEEEEEKKEEEEEEDGWIEEAVENVRRRYVRVVKGVEMVEEELGDDMESVLKEIEEVEEGRKGIKEEVARLKGEGEVLLKRIEEKSEQEWRKQKKVKLN
ncbi:hypothetical protein TrLO_g8791 [Triparma laevis f. longispina]|uniref:Uncharacterized protein n=1 Tax=Triparma laevis f. longispina TaxID=1714387 RepID=A0A9W7AQW8_9STRA|nr:hypothetical protein TrLO_g8791 [Triparma laevis f. longispina]